MIEFPPNFTDSAKADIYLSLDRSEWGGWLNTLEEIRRLPELSLDDPYFNR